MAITNCLLKTAKSQTVAELPQLKPSLSGGFEYDVDILPLAGLIYAEPHRLESTASRELLNQFKAIEKMADNDKNVIKTLIDAFITKRKVQQLAL